MQIVLTIAGFDPSSGAGMTADLQVFAAHGCFGTSCITGLTVQSTLGVEASYPVGGKVIAETLGCLHADLPAAGIKIGMLASSEAVEAVAAFIDGLRRQGSTIPVVLDPVIRSSSGRELLDERGVAALQSRLLPLVDWITPNLDELGLLSGNAANEQKGMVASALKLQDQLAARDSRRVNILAKGGHLVPADDFVLSSTGDQHWLRGERVETRSTHGTGCALSSALLCRLISGGDAITAARQAKHYVTEALRRATPIGHGDGPMDLIWPLRSDSHAGPHP